MKVIRKVFIYIFALGGWNESSDDHEYVGKKEEHNNWCCGTNRRSPSRSVWSWGRFNVQVNQSGGDKEIDYSERVAYDTVYMVSRRTCKKKGWAGKAKTYFKMKL